MTAPLASAPAVARALDALARTRRARRPGAPLVLIDGLSGAGKSTLAATVAPPGGPWRILGLDSYYPGWDGLKEGSRETARIARDLAAGRDTHYTPWDWEEGRPLAPVPLPAGIPTVIEGCGALTPASRASADLAVWVEAGGGADQRRARALARDGDVYAPHWRRWAAQDGARDGARLADVVVRT